MASLLNIEVMLAIISFSTHHLRVLFLLLAIVWLLRKIMIRTLHPMSYIQILGELAEARGAYQQAVALYQRVLTICERAFGDNHPETALSTPGHKFVASSAKS